MGFILHCHLINYMCMYMYMYMTYINYMLSYKLYVYEEGKQPHENSTGSMVISDYCINVGQLLEGTLLPFN